MTTLPSLPILEALPELGTALAIYRQLKAVMDPDAILNPGKMGL